MGEAAEQAHHSYRKTVRMAAFAVTAAAVVGVGSLAVAGGTVGWIVAAVALVLALLAGAVFAGGEICLRRDADQESGVGWHPTSRPHRPRAASPAAASNAPPALRAGDWAEVRPASEILATLDAYGRLDALPFMPEMLAHCGKRFPVTHDADKILDMIDKRGHRMRRLRRAAFLDDLRCDGSAHDGCQQGCKIIWKAAWLKRVEPGEGSVAPARDDLSRTREQLLPHAKQSDPESTAETLYTCQATELLRASEPMHAWDPRQDLRAVTSGNVRPAHLVVALLVRAFNFAQRLRGGACFPLIEPSCSGKTPQQQLNLRPGEWIEVKSIREIEKTLDVEGRNRGMRFDHEMVRFCGGRYRVRSRVDRLVDEKTGRMLTLRNPCIILEGVEATGEFLRFNPQREYPYWREIWLRRIESPS